MSIIETRRPIFIILNYSLVRVEITSPTMNSPAATSPTDHFTESDFTDKLKRSKN